MRERGERGERHPVHFDAMELPRLREDIASGLFDALALDVPLIRVTVEGYDPPFEEIGVALRPVSNG